MANENRYYKTPFAESGNKTEIPDVSVGGAVGYDSGYGPDYELPQGSVNRKRIERDLYNGMFNGVTKNLKQWQENLYPTWIEDNGDGVAFSYSEGMIVSHNDIDYISLEDANQEEPGTGVKWAVHNDILFESSVINFQTIAEAANSDKLKVGLTLLIGDRGNSVWDVVLTSGVTPNTYNVVESDEDASLSLVLRAGGVFNVKHFGAVGDGVEDDTAAIQAAINAALVTKSVTHIPAGIYLVTSALSCPIGAQIEGVKNDQYPDGFGVDPLATTINFQPTSPASLFITNGTSHTGFRFQYYIANMYLEGLNSDALNALDLNGSIYGNYKNISIKGFVDGISCDATINNRFENCHITGCSNSCVIYAGSIETTDVWEQCSFFAAPTGIQFNGSSVSIRFSNCLFEQLGRFGLDIALECQSIILENCYAEDVIFDGTSTDSFIRLGNRGVSAQGGASLTIIGGVYNGRNAGTVGTFLDCVETNGVQIVGAVVNRFEQVIKVDSTNVRDGSVGVYGVQGITWTNGFLVGDADKVRGVVPTGPLTDATVGSKLAVSVAYIPEIMGLEGTNSISIGVANTQVGAGSLYPSADNVAALGLSTLRWGNIYAGTGTINTSDERQKEQGRDLTDTEKAVALDLKSLIKSYKFSEAVIKKGEEARIHFGVYAQDVKSAFEEHGLDGMNYGVLCYDEWEDEYEDIYDLNEYGNPILDEEGNKIVVEQKQVKTAGNRYGIRYEELLCFIIASM